MDIAGKRVLVLGGWGLVGSAICRRLFPENPQCIVVGSLHREEAEVACQRYAKEASHIRFAPVWGDIFLRYELRERGREDIFADAQLRRRVMLDSLEKLTDEILTESTIFKFVETQKPDLIIDCVNSATGLAYQDPFTGSSRILHELDAAREKGKLTEALQVEIERFLSCLTIPQLIRHIEILKNTLARFKVQSYLKIGTTGTGGMGLNIPYTHSEERPSRVLMAKSAVAGAQSLLLMLLGRTPGEPAVKEIKPAAAIAWKEIAYGPVQRGGQPIELVDCLPDQAIKLEDTFHSYMPELAAAGNDVLKSVYIDTGENGIFSYGEFYAISSIGQMEFVTPEEIADYAVLEIKGATSGYDVISALDAAVLGPTYRAGAMRESALKTMRELQEKHGVESVAFELLGPPRLSKLLYEVHLLQKTCGSLSSVLKSSPKELARKVELYVRRERGVRSQILSIGIPILLADGKSLLRGPQVKIPASKVKTEFAVTPDKINEWADAGWVDLREKNFAVWQSRLKELKAEMEAIPARETSSAYHWNHSYWGDDHQILDPGKIVGWIFVRKEGELGGMRTKR